MVDVEEGLLLTLSQELVAISRGKLDDLELVSMPSTSASSVVQSRSECEIR